MVCKFLCGHKWEILKEVGIKNYRNEIWKIELLLTCNKCGKIKKITV